MNVAEKIKKVFSNGETSNQVHLNTKQADAFIDYVRDETTLLGKVRIKRMNTPQEDIAILGIGEEVLYPSGRDGAVLKETKAKADKITLVTKKVKGVVSILDDELEDNIEGKSFKEHLMRIVAKLIRNQIEGDMIYSRYIGNSSSDSANVVSTKNQFSGILEQAGVIVDADSSIFDDRSIDKLKLSKLRRGFKTKYRNGMETFLSDSLAQDYVDKYAALAGWNTLDQNGVFGKKFNIVWNMQEDGVFVSANAVNTTIASVTQGSNSVTVAAATGLTAGASVVINYGKATEFATTIESISGTTVTLEDAVPYELTDATLHVCDRDGAEVIMCDPKNIIWGIQRDITIEYEREAKNEKNNFYFSLRMDFKIENPEAVGYIKNLKVN